MLVPSHISMKENTTKLDSNDFVSYLYKSLFLVQVKCDGSDTRHDLLSHFIVCCESGHTSATMTGNQPKWRDVRSRDGHASITEKSEG